MDTFVAEMLTAWQLGNLIETFKEEEVDEESFRLLDTNAIAALIPKIGQRVKFQKHHNELASISFAESSQAASVAPAPVDESTFRNGGNLQPTCVLNLELEPTFSTRQILQETIQGREILRSLDEQSSINTKQRKSLARLLVAHLISTHGETPNREIKKALAMALVQDFPCLLAATGSGYGAWYAVAHKNKPATGFLEERLRNIRKRIRKQRWLACPHAHQEEQTAPDVPEPDLSCETLKEMVEWLKNNRYPVSQVEEYMKKTAIQRGRWIRDDPKSVQEVLTEFPRLIDPGMISQDFQQLYPEAGAKLFENWPSMSDRILEMAQREGKLPPVYDDMTPERALKVLPCLLPPPCYKIGRKSHRPTIEESCKAFINIQPVGTNMVQYLEIADPLPHILCLGDENTTSQAFAIVSDNAIEADTLLGAVDLCFKAYYVFQMHYTVKCRPTWEFLQNAMYDIAGEESSIVKFLRTSIAA